MWSVADGVVGAGGAFGGVDFAADAGDFMKYLNSVFLAVGLAADDELPPPMLFRLADIVLGGSFEIDGGQVYSVVVAPHKLVESII